MFSDHKPVNGSYEVELFKPLLTFPPISERENNPDGRFKFYEIKFNFDILIWPFLQKQLGIGSPPLEILITFKADFLSYSVYTVPIKIEEDD